MRSFSAALPFSTLATRSSRLVPLLLGLLAGTPPDIGTAATITVTTLADSDSSDGDCSFREAIVAANGDSSHQGCAAGSGPDRIEFAVTGAVMLGSNLPAITKDLTISGPPHAAGAAPLVTLNGAEHRLLVMNGSPNGRTLRIENLTIRNGFTPNAGACITLRTADRLELFDSRVVDCESESYGAAIFAELAASATIVRSTIRDNVAWGGSAAIYFVGEGYEAFAGSDGIGAEPTATFLLEDSTISGNEAPDEAANGGMTIGYANGTIRRSTISGNRAGDAAVGVYFVFGELTIDSTTITANVGDTNGDDTAELGAGLYTVGEETRPSTVYLRNSVIGGNFGFALPSDLFVGPFAAILSEGFNLIGVRDGASAFFPLGAPNANDDWVGSRTSPVLAGLAALSDNGGPTDTHAPSPGSLIVDHGSCPAELRDQRGFGNLTTQRRPVDQILVPDAADGCDIGAFEADAVALPISLFLDGFESADTAAWSATAP
jgi:CSLREA domain-containing protein